MFDSPIKPDQTSLDVFLQEIFWQNLGIEVTIRNSGDLSLVLLRLLLAQKFWPMQCSQKCSLILFKYKIRAKLKIRRLADHP